MGGASSCCGSPYPDIRDAYTPLRRLGAGAAGDVWLARERASGALYALKFLKRGMHPWQVRSARCSCSHVLQHARAAALTRRACAQADCVAREVQLSLQLGVTHVNVVRPHELVLTRRHVVLATAYEAGGTLAAHCARHAVDEPTACFFFRQLVAALAFCHAQQVAFRDVKPQNVLLDGNDPPQLLLCDFGVARRWRGAPGCDGGQMRTLAGTPGFLSPQVLGVLFEPHGGAGYDGAAADVWSAGVLLCLMLAHRLPFSFDELAAALDGPSALRTAWEAELRSRWHAGDAALRARLSPAALDLLDRMLEPDERARITLPDVRAHAWSAQRLPARLQAALDAQAAAQARLEADCGPECAALREHEPLIAQLVRRATALGTTPGVEARLLLIPQACAPRANAECAHPA
jgi:serine/threonine-protein kinase SRK2